MKDYQIATYLELKDYKAPKNLNCIFLPMQDGKKIRLILSLMIIPILQK